MTTPVISLIVLLVSFVFDYEQLLLMKIDMKIKAKNSETNMGLFRVVSGFKPLNAFVHVKNA